jgi:tRNA-intron endonuclease
MNKIQIHIFGTTISSNSPEAFSLYKKSSFGEPSGEKINYLPVEALFLLEKKKAEIFLRNKKIIQNEALKSLQRIDRRINLKYAVFEDLRKKGYVVKTALKFGADFRVYEKGSKPGKKHAKWIVFTDFESGKFNWHEFSAKNRVAHSTKKNLLLAIVDGENKVSYYEIAWIRP